MPVTAAHGYPAHSGVSSVPNPGEAAEVYSDTAKQWISATVLRSDGSVITLAYKRNGECVEKTLPWPCRTHLRFPRALRDAVPLAAPLAAPLVPRSRPVCKMGIKCKIREPQHLTTFAHPFDPDYQHCHAGFTAEMASLRNLFTWVDTDGSGKILPKELQEAAALAGATAWRSVDANQGILGLAGRGPTCHTCSRSIMIDDDISTTLSCL